VLPIARCPRRPIRPPVGSVDPQKCCSKGMRWAREELNLRPLPCQIQRAIVGLYVGRLETGKDHGKAAAESGWWRRDTAMIRDARAAIVPVPTWVDCCSSAARRGIEEAWAAAAPSSSVSPPAGCGPRCRGRVGASLDGSLWRSRGSSRSCRYSRRPRRCARLPSGVLAFLAYYVCG
jgi:hypothetical protein